MATNSTPPRRRRRGPSFKLAELPWRRIGVGLALFALAAAILYRSIDIEALHEQAARMPGALAFTLLVVLPLIGMPVSLLHVAAGIRFGGILGYALVVLSIVLQLLASYAIVKVWRHRFEHARWLARLKKRIPRGAQAAVCAFTVLLPGAPYAAVNYSLPLLGVPLRTLLLCALPLHALRATITVAFGDQSAHLTATRLSVLAAYALLILAVCGWMYRRLQSRFADPQPAADGRKRSA